jgi:hypothetical protein
MTNFIKKNIIDRFKNINIFNSNNSYEEHYIPESTLNESDQSDYSDQSEHSVQSGSELYDALVLNARGISLIYKYLLRFIILNPQYRKLCKCCITNTEKSVLCDYNYNIKVNNITDNTLKLNFLINKFLDILGEFKCSCNYKKSSFYTHKFYNYYKIYKLYNDVIPILISYLTSNNASHQDVNICNESNENISNEINKNIACIHNDIIKYKNYSYCRHVNTIINEDDVSRNSDLISKIININDWIVENNKVVISLFNKQSYDYICMNIERWNDMDAINKGINGNAIDKGINRDVIDKGINRDVIDKGINGNAIDKGINGNAIDKGINRVYNVDFVLVDIDNRLIRIVLVNNNLSDDVKRKFIELITIKTLEKYKLEIVVLKLCEYIIEILNHKYYDFGLYVLNNITTLYKNVFNMIEHILNIVVNSVEIDITLQIEYIKVIYKLYDNTSNKENKSDIINKLVSISHGDIIINHFKNNYNFLVHCDEYNDKKYIIKIIKRCIIYKKHILLDYVLSLINKVNKVKININYYQHYFQTIYNECNKLSTYCDYKYSLLLDVICIKNKVNINKIYNDSCISNIKNGNIGYLEFCIKNNYIYSAKVLIKNNINLESSLNWCIDNKNYIIASYILTSNTTCIFNNMVDTITHLFDKITDEIILLKFVDKIVYTCNNHTSQINTLIINTLVYKVIDSKIIQYYNKVVFINKMKHLINPFEQKEPLILYTITNNDGKGMYEITYLLLMQLFVDNKIKMQNDFINLDMKEIISNNINNYSYYDSKINFNVIPIILQYIKHNYTNVDYSYFIEFNIYKNEVNMYNVITIAIYFSIFLIHNITHQGTNHGTNHSTNHSTNHGTNHGTNQGTNITQSTTESISILSPIVSHKNTTIDPKSTTIDPKSTTINPKNTTIDPKSTTINPKSTIVPMPMSISSKNIFNNKNSVKSSMYIEIEDNDTNTNIALLETEPEPKSEQKPKPKSKFKIKADMVIDSKTVLFTENTNISSDIEDNEIYTFS